MFPKTSCSSPGRGRPRLQPCRCIARLTKDGNLRNRALREDPQFSFWSFCSKSSTNSLHISSYEEAHAHM
jgi:hypothetical protein